MNQTINFLKSKFADYYSNVKINFPERFTKREWGFMFIGERFMQRHLSFRKTSELVKFLSAGSTGTGPGREHRIRPAQKTVPSHVYYSSAYYSEPGLQPMQAKVAGWLGADLIFDLDDDHLRNVEGLTYEERLKKVKEIVRHKLLDDFFLNDLGFDPKFITIAFSGSRGYHIHVKDPQLLTLTSPERREIVDYLTGVGLDTDKILPYQVFDVKEYGTKKFAKKPKLVTRTKCVVRVQCCGFCVHHPEDKTIEAAVKRWNRYATVNRKGLMLEHLERASDDNDSPAWLQKYGTQAVELLRSWWKARDKA